MPPTLPKSLTMKKSIYSLPEPDALMQAGVHRYSQWLAGLAEHTAGHRDITRLGRAEHDAQGRSYRGFNPFLGGGRTGAPNRVERRTCVGGVDRPPAASVLHSWSRGRISRLLKRLRLHGLLRKVGRTYTYHFTSLARRVIPAVLHIKNTSWSRELATASAG